MELNPLQGTYCVSHQPDKVNHLIPHPNTRTKRACIEVKSMVCIYHIGVRD